MKINLNFLMCFNRGLFSNIVAKYQETIKLNKISCFNLFATWTFFDYHVVKNSHLTGQSNKKKHRLKLLLLFHCDFYEF